MSKSSNLERQNMVDCTKDISSNNGIVFFDETSFEKECSDIVLFNAEEEWKPYPTV